MNFLPPIIALTLSAFIGYLFLDLITKKSQPLHFILKLILGAGLGLGLSSHLTFASFLFLNRLEPNIVIVVHGIIFCALLIWRMLSRSPNLLFNINPIHIFHWRNVLINVIIFLLCAYVVQQALYYPQGGWDAWQVWNFKAKFLLLSGDNWQNLFTPELWRSSPHYPLLLPMINVWAWLLTQNPVSQGPLTVAVAFTVMAAGLVSSLLWQKTRNIFSLVPAFLLLSLPYYNLYTTVQYCDIVLAFYLLAAIGCLMLRGNRFILLSGIFTGFLGFTKPEGLVAAVLLLILITVITLISTISQDQTNTWKSLWLFICGFLFASLPMAAFHILYSPGNQTFINGLTSSLKPSTGQRLQIIFAYLGIELINKKWNGFWLLLFLGILLGKKQLWSHNNKITGGFLIMYSAVILVYYQLNTYFEITWWLSVSLSRILISLLPLGFLWVFSGILEVHQNKR